MSKQTSNNPFGSWKMILLLIMAGAVVLSLSPVSAEKPFITIVAKGDQSYYMGEKVVFSGMNTDSDSTYLFITGPNLAEGGGKLASPNQNATSGIPGSFTLVKIKPDKTWEYTWYTSDVLLGAGTYTIYAVTKPETKDQFNNLTTYGTVGIIYKKPFITGGISPSSVSQGQPFTVSGVAEGDPETVQIWILGKNYYSKSKVSVNSDASFKYVVPQEVTSQLANGQYFIIVQHPMQNTTFDIDASGDYVRSLQNDTTLFGVSGTGSLQGSDAADALVAAFSDTKNGDDTYTEIPFQVTDTGSGATAGTGVTISADGDKSYYQGEKVVFSGHNYDSDTTYLFITGPGTFMTGPGVPDNGGKLTSPRQGVVSGIPGSFDIVKTQADKSWEYVYYTHNLNVDAGTYSVYAVSQPQAKDQLNGVSSANVGIILKKPFLTGEISPISISERQPFTISGTAEGDPETVQIWILGKNYYSKSKVPVSSDASYKYVVTGEVTSQLANGQYFVIVQHPMQNTMFDIDVSGDYVRSLQLNNGTNLFGISGPGSLQGSDAADALVAAFSDPDTGDDTYTEIPFQVTDAGSPTPQTTDASTAPVQQSTEYGLLGDLEKALRSFF